MYSGNQVDNNDYFRKDTEPIMNQPPRYIGSPGFPQTTVIIQQPGNYPTENTRMWSSGLFSCFDDIASCVCFILCPTCGVSRLYSRYDECCCTPCFVPHALLALRVQHRNRHKVMGTMLNDCFTSTCCYLCAACQLKRDMDFVVNTKGTLLM